MPNIVGHLGLALEALRRWPEPLLLDHRGAYLLGSSAPDIRAMTKQARGDTHFAPLDAPDPLAGVEGLFRAHPHLRNPDRLTPPTRAFLVGYLSHLILDQVWVVQVYRPYFGNPEVYDDSVEGNIADRALQLALDREVAGEVEALRPVLEGAEREVEVGFIPSETLARWREWVQEMVERKFTWERLRFMARRQYGDNRPDVADRVDRFLADVPAGLERIYERVPRDALLRFREEGLDLFLKTARGYLACAFSAA